MSRRARRLRRLAPRPRTGDEVAVANRVVVDGKFKDPMEHQPAAAQLRRLKRNTNSFK